MKVYKILIMTLFAVGLLSCTSVPQQGKDGVGALSLKVKNDESVNLIQKSKSSASDLALYIINAAKDTVLTYSDVTSIPEKITLRFGSYKAVYESKTIHSGATFDGHTLRGESSFNITAGTSTTVEVTAKIADVLVSVAYSDRFKSLLSDYDLALTSDLGHTITIAKDEVRRVAMALTDKLSYRLRIKDDTGKDVFYAKDIAGLKPADHLELKFDVSPSNDPTNNSTFRVFVDMTINDVTHNFEMNLNPGEAPVVTPVNFDPKQDIILNDNVDAKAKVRIEAGNELYGIFINSDNAIFAVNGLPKKMNILTLTEAQKTTLASLGVVVVEEGTGAYPTRVPVGAVEIDMFGLSKRLGSGTHNFVVSALDVNYLASELFFRFDAAGNPVKMTSATAHEIYRTDKDGAKVVMEGFYTTSNAPAGLTFKYRKSEESQWSTVPTTDVKIDADGKKFIATVFLPQNSSFVIKPISAPDGKETDGSGEASVTTTAIPNLPNLSFDNWAQSGKSWYPNIDASNSFWATGNEGVTGSPVNMSANTIPEDNIVVKGRAVKMTSVAITLFISPVKFAAGNLFTGTYKTNISKPIESVQFGRPFTGRPDQLSGYYFYTPADYNGGKDYCHIYLKLENRSNGNVTVGYGELQSNRTDMTGYEPFTIDVNYTSELPVTHVTMTATSSVDGGNFKGGVGSLLYVDEFKLIYNGK